MAVGDVDEAVMVTVTVEEAAEEGAIWVAEEEAAAMAEEAVTAEEVAGDMAEAAVVSVDRCVLGHLALRGYQQRHRLDRRVSFWAQSHINNNIDYHVTTSKTWLSSGRPGVNPQTQVWKGGNVTPDFSPFCLFMFLVVS